jgi:DNA repair protein RAD5
LKDPSAIDVVQTILEPLIIRRTKDMTDSKGNLIVPLPPKYVHIEYMDFSLEEEALYKSFSQVRK